MTTDHPDTPQDAAPPMADSPGGIDATALHAGAEQLAADIVRRKVRQSATGLVVMSDRMAELGHGDDAMTLLSASRTLSRRFGAAPRGGRAMSDRACHPSRGLRDLELRTLGTDLPSLTAAETCAAVARIEARAVAMASAAPRFGPDMLLLLAEPLALSADRADSIWRGVEAETLREAAGRGLGRFGAPCRPAGMPPEAGA